MAVTKPKMYELIRATGSRLKPGDVLEAGGRTIRVNRQGNVRVADPGFARELEAKYGKRAPDYRHRGQLIGAELETYNQARHLDPVRRTHYWTMPEMPWKRKGRRKDKDT